MNREIRRLVYDAEQLPFVDPEDIFRDASELIEDAGFVRNSNTNPAIQGFAGLRGFTLFGALAQAYYGYPEIPVSVQLGFQPELEVWRETISILRQYLIEIGEPDADEWHSQLAKVEAIKVLQVLAARASEDPDAEDADDDDSWEDDDDD